MFEAVSRSRRLTSVAAATLVGLGLVAGSSVNASADPDAVKQAERTLVALEAKGVKLQDDYTKLAEQLGAANAKAGRLEGDLKRQQAGVTGVRAKMGQIAQVQYRTTGLDATIRLLAAPDDTAFLRQLGQMQSMQSRANAKVQTYQVQQGKIQVTLTQLQQVRSQIAAAKAQQGELLKQQAQAEREARATVERLTKEEQARLARLRAEKAAREAAEVAAREARNSRSEQRPNVDTASTTANPTSSPTTQRTSETKKSTSDQPTVVPGSSRGQIAANYALSKVGGPYVHGGNGPRGFDCSGLTSAAWRAAGVSLPRTASGQYRVGVPVSLSQLQPGDLVFYYSGISHVGIYVGNGKIVDAANPRRGIRITSVTGNYMPYMGARRVG